MEGPDYMKLLPYAVALGAVLFSVVRAFRGSNQQINKSIQKDMKKVRDVVQTEDLGESTSYCRCWRSQTFPLCDGAHKSHNKLTGDNIGPIVIKKKV